MFFFSKKTTIAASGILQGATDHHSHILPGVDDGVETMDEALRILATYEAAGIKTLWLTPHIMEDIPNTPQKLEARFLELKAAYTGKIVLHLAAEYMIDNHLRKLLQETNKLRPALEGRWHEQSEVTEGSRTKNCPSFKRGTSNAGSIAEGVKDNYNSPSSKREYPQGEGVEKDSNTENNCPSSRGTSDAVTEGVKQSETTEGTKTKNCPSFERGTSNTGNIAEGVKDNYNSPSSKREYPQGEGVEKKSIAEGVELLPLGSKGNHLLVETSYYNPPMRFRETLRQIKSLGYHPLLAHPERYMYMDNDEYQELHDEGVRFQLNLPSLCGAYGNTVKKRAKWLLKNGLYDAIGSDTHCEEGAKFLMEGKIEEKHITALQMLKNSII